MLEMQVLNEQILILPSMFLGCWLFAHGFNFELSLRDAETGEHNFVSKAPTQF